MATISSTGLATGVASGATTIQASYQSVNGTTLLDVSGSISPPTGLIATAGNAQVSLSWQALNSATSYAVYRSTITGGPYTSVGSSTLTSYTDTGLTNNTSYFYVITAMGTGGTSGYSNEASATPEFASCFANIQHIVFIIKENRSFDNLFGTYPGANGANTATLSTGEIVPLGHTADRISRDVDHSWWGSFTDIDYGFPGKLLAGSRCSRWRLQAGPQPRERSRLSPPASPQPQSRAKSEPAFRPKVPVYCASSMALTNHLQTCGG